MKRHWAPRHWGTLITGTVVLWWTAVTWIVPWVIRAAHAGRIPVIGDLMPGRENRPVDGYLERWVPIARSSAVMVLTAALVLVAVLLFRR